MLSRCSASRGPTASKVEQSLQRACVSEAGFSEVRSKAELGRFLGLRLFYTFCLRRPFCRRERTHDDGCHIRCRRSLQFFFELGAITVSICLPRAARFRRTGRRCCTIFAQRLRAIAELPYQSKAPPLGGREQFAYSNPCRSRRSMGTRLGVAYSTVSLKLITMAMHARGAFVWDSHKR